MPTRQQIKESLELASTTLAALDGALELAGDKEQLRSYCADIHQALETWRFALPEFVAVSGVPKVEVPLAEWYEIERLTGAKLTTRDTDMRQRARRVVSRLEQMESERLELRNRLVTLTGVAEPK